MAHRDRAGRVSPASVQSSVIAFFPAPDNHLAAGPNCSALSNWRVLVTGRYPTIGGGSISPAIEIRSAVAASSSPNDHFTANPNRKVTATRSRGVRCTCGGPTVGARIVPAASVYHVGRRSAPNNHFTPSPDCAGTVGGRCVRCARGGPSVSAGIVSAAQATPADLYNHFTASPDCGII